jgi:hypothetical protein
MNDLDRIQEITADSLLTPFIAYEECRVAIIQPAGAFMRSAVGVRSTEYVTSKKVDSLRLRYCRAVDTKSHVTQSEAQSGF